MDQSEQYWPWLGKYISILGASIETLEGWNPPGYAVFYTKERSRLSRICTPEDTWWGKVIAQLGGTLLINNAWSGSRATRLPNADGDFPSACSIERTGALHNEHVAPDVILVHIGGNDFGYGVPIRRRTFQKGNKMEFFSCAYRMMLRRLRRNYPNAEIWCMGIGRTYMSARPEFVFPENFGGVPCADYNREIERLAHHYGCAYINLYQRGTYDTIDGTHPTYEGMGMLANLVLREISQKF